MSLVYLAYGLPSNSGAAIIGYNLGKNGWDFTPDEEGCTSNPVNNFPHTKAIYQSVAPDYNLRCTVPILYDERPKGLSTMGRQK